ncbi:microcystin degradation protein MlrC [Pelagivirga sediminicola]|uniref:Microcystinase C n=1 Tax=Pelagivirga sediminicola TaxID=2170575 RepID=A0A2T7G820_9RHOB|nr:M81 family metallopeptidase [Pelagivirga sediminicola]PVA10573.1 microcystin degradation protein MlrC [Pelagivirga sediminicola]
MRIVAARFNHETNTFSPVKTPLEAFAPLHGQAALDFGRGSATAFGAFIEYAEAEGAELITPLSATANPSGPATAEVFEALAGPIVEAAQGGCDAILLDLHGAMVADGIDDCEGELLARVRAAAPGVPLGVALDLHGNITPRMVENCDCIVGFKTYPHIDMFETGRHVTRIVDAMLHKGLRPKMALSHPPILAHTLKMNTEEPCLMTDLIAAARDGEARGGLHAATIFGGFPIADLAETGVSIVTVAEGADAAQDLADDLARMAWEGREGFVYDEAPLATSLAEAVRAADGPGEGPVLLLDHGDNCMSGGTCDTVDVLRAALEAGMSGIIAGPICDPETVAQMIAAGTGAAIMVDLGNKVPLPGFAPKAPLTLTGTVGQISDGTYVVSGPIYTGQTCRMGRAAVLETGGALVLVTELPHEPWDLGVFGCAGIDPIEARFLILKSRMYCRPVFAPLSRALVECASEGITSSNFDLFPFEKLQRPIFPLDRDMRWSPGRNT